jgi:hypothetical protein
MELHHGINEEAIIRQFGVGEVIEIKAHTGTVIGSFLGRTRNIVILSAGCESCRDEQEQGYNAEFPTHRVISSKKMQEFKSN